MQSGMRWAEEEEKGLSKHRAKPVTFAQFYPEANGVTSSHFLKVVVWECKFLFAQTVH